ncbi:MAG: flagellar basal body rod protein FlgB [Rhodobacter sp. CACIA14H1]|nr:MAG: flagellar basal body rod protein FlgB [Rhodobacter sp. CACIA14H1]
MFERLEMTRMAQALAAHSGARLGLVARNIAHADTPGFRAQDLPDFATVYAGGIDPRRLRPTETRGPQDPNGNSVRLDDQMVRMAGIRMDHDMALAVQRSTSSILRAALGRGGA